MDVPRARRRDRRAGRRAAGLAALGAVVTVAIAALGPASPAAAASGSWGTTGAYYTDGIVCRLATTTVPLTSWAVNGAANAYSLTDIVATAGVYGPAPLTGAAGPIGAGQGGLDGGDVGAAAYLIEHHAQRGSVGVAETSADIAALAGDGSIQQQCLGQGGTSAAGAGAALTDARRYAGPYTVQVGVPSAPLPGANATVTATVVSAAGQPTPGITVTFSVNGGQTTATTGSDGRASTSVSTPPAAVPVTATVTEATSLIAYATDPASVSLAPATSTNGTAVLRPAPPPRPTVAVSTPPLVLGSGTVTPVIAIGGTFGYAGAGTVTVSGPVAPAVGRTCNDLGAADFARVRPVWTAPFDFTGDGSVRAGSTSALSPGCYAATSTLRTTNSTPPVQASSGFREAATVAVSSLQVEASSAAPVATPGTLTSTVTATNPGRATVASSVQAYGPLPPRAGRCDGLTWTGAHVAVTSAATPLTATGDATHLRATITAPSVSGLGCYALSARSVVTQDGRTATVGEDVGRAGATTLVAAPTLTLVTSSYGGEQGRAMSGTVTVQGTYAFPGTVSIGLRAATSSPVDGCRSATFDALPERSTPTTVTTRGDGSYTFRTPVAPRNLCYAITGTLTLAANPLVRADSPPPSDQSVFLAGAQTHATSFDDSRSGSGSNALRTVIAFALAIGLLLLLALVIMVRAYRSAREYGELGEGWRPYRNEDRPRPHRNRPAPGPLL